MQFWRYREGKAENDPNYTECPFRFAGQYEDEESGFIIAFAIMIGNRTVSFPRPHRVIGWAESVWVCALSDGVG